MTATEIVERMVELRDTVDGNKFIEEVSNMLDLYDPKTEEDDEEEEEI